MAKDDNAPVKDDNAPVVVTGYCVKCRVKDREMKDAREVSMKGKGGVERKAMTGLCAVCGTKMFKILGKPKTE